MSYYINEIWADMRSLSFRFRCW